MSKRKMVVIFVALLLITNLGTLVVGNFVSVMVGNRVILARSEYEELNDVYRSNAKIQQVKKVIEEMYLREYDEEDLYEGQLKGMVEALGDPYSVYMTKDEYERFNMETDGIYGGIGIIVTPGEDDLITVVSPIEDTPGERAGIRTGDKIIKVEGKEYFSSTMDEAVSLMRGEPNTEVRITIMRRDKEGNTESFDLNITREIIRLQSVKSGVIQDDIGYIRLTAFDNLTYEDFMKALMGIQSENVKGIVLDLRSNPGGLLNVSVDIADELLGEGTVVYTEDKYERRQYEESDSKMVDLPLVVLVNEGSASASEILAGAIRDLDRGTLVGTTTFGKGLVQRIRDLPDGSGIKVTVSEYFTPDGINIHGTGIQPDVIVELNEDVEGIGLDYLDQDNQLQKAIEVLREKL
ncbi:S41 family peptidase [Gudongella sp. SC589]|uniref:S41 family peptidase n=1 Tax=Gudongella sp. SC589 TaxID=3385990 RepID=UPI003904A6F3